MLSCFGHRFKGVASFSFGHSGNTNVMVAEIGIFKSILFTYGN